MSFRAIPLLPLALLVACSQGTTGTSSSSSGSGGNGGNGGNGGTGGGTSTSAGGAGGTGGQKPLGGTSCADAVDVTAQVAAGSSIVLPASSTLTPPVSKCSTDPGAKVYLSFTIAKGARYGFDSNAKAIVLRHQCDVGAQIACFDYSGGTAVLKKGVYHVIADGVPDQGLNLTIAPDYYCNSVADCAADQGRPVCDYSNKCVACMATSDCPAGQFCDKASETCNGCSTDADCAASIFGSKCSPLKTCGCTAAADCTGQSPVCGASGLCLSCAAGLGDCDADPTTGCESDPVVDGLNCSACGAGCAGGGCNGSACGPAPAAELPGVKPSVFALDGGTVYYFDALAKALMAAPLAGGNPTTVVSGESSIDAIAVDATRVFYSDLKGVSSVLKAGGGAIAYTQDAHLSFTIASDGTSVFWADASGSMIRSAPVGGGAVKKLASIGMAPVITLDATNVYAMDESGLQKIPKAGGVAKLLWASSSNCHVLWTDATFGYTAETGSLVAVPLGGGSAVPLFDLAAHGFSCIDGLVGDATNLYMHAPTKSAAFPRPSRLFRLPKAGGSPTNLADGQLVFTYGFDQWFGNFGLGATSVYWLVNGPALMSTAK
jgi:hypothetical protein